MSDIKTVPMTPELRKRWQRAVDETAAEFPELLDLGERLREAAQEETLSGHLRRAIHRSRRRLDAIAAAGGITTADLNGFLSGERTLRSDVLDRLALAVEFTESRQETAQTSANESPIGASAELK